MTAINFDTLKFTRQLTDAGMPQSQAEATAEALKEAVGESELVTRTDIHELKIDLIKWMVGLLIAQTALLVALFDMLNG
uniref:DUF1640 domain-containing protein n=1 Tax=Candidatus Kentrum eta TaxID=2126337 RepID=A0A450UUC4_9GAMM|nr:MAG: hypothetical protein BECKH772A_GA0070896_1000514 [Candidatus Kentron sp. H]VFJ89509.1 MAG: hypothetical protein BECKH772B_GA0070898_1000514 [Candidatus Kentron sp. H]VFJ96183.1 MAG: hypothetical protein BECKH772C_GA0070978_1000514 [Candidatus Kentron sp. H]